MLNDTGSISATYIHHVGKDLTVVNAARTSYQGESEEFTERDAKLLKYLADHAHLTPFEHCSLTVQITCPLYVRSQIHRHRTASYNEQSRRYTDKNPVCYSPRIYRNQSSNNRQSSQGANPESERFAERVDKFQKDALSLYESMLTAGICREQARGILPQNLLTTFWMTCNVRNWAHFLKLRLASDAQEEVRLIATQIYEILKLHYPVSMEALLGESAGKIPD